MHLASEEQAQRRVIDEHKVCAAIDGLGDPASTQTWAQRFGMLGDPTRLRLLLCIRAAGPISVSDLAVAASLADATVSQTLRFLRASNAVTAERDGRVIRYQIADPHLASLLGLVTQPG